MAPAPNRPDSKKPLMRNLGEFFGHIVKGLRTDPESRAERKVVRKKVEEERRDNLVLRRTTIEEIEVRPEAPGPDDRSSEPRCP